VKFLGVIRFFSIGFMALICLSSCERFRSSFADKSLQKKEDTRMIKVTTNLGSFEISLDAKKAPISVDNFIEYIEAGHYNGTIFHRVIDGFMIQGGGFDKDLNQKPTRAAIKNESANGLQNKAMTIAMARLPDPDSATAQFFINLVDNSNLDGSSSQPGYAVFGQLTKGQDIVEKIAKVPTSSKSYYDDVPVEPVVIEKIEVIF